ncbi:nucleotide-sugar transporter (macronuclear) [Tetrahymena thermophila SB210]|uniref:Nucleotide-sugar transporter n=1 Tax=Tetrahymena thermophila (strain SB210) TaxID=312017 RepID=Q24CL3_TETTS|nr:nucleotide-sugar transporter [Tetrahymena thermophila SB210]EAS05516.1 nucleotide-sugar transporter [Tetrahymena thermophila SB210]|eukprot:XP_001025761.1 nucleotide-sugar transporter [Tetrahymena thermophila SB210]
MAWTEMQKNMLMLVSLGCSLCSGIIFKSQQRQTVDGQSFNHPFCQTLIMFVGELLCYGVFVFYKRKYAEDYEKDRKESIAQGQSDKINIFIFAAPAACDMVTSTISFFSMNLMPLSMQYMFNGGNIIMTAIFSVVFLKRKLHRQNIFGIFLNVTGLAFMGLMALVVDSNSIENPTQMMIGIILLVCSFFTYATQMVVEERFFGKYFLHPFQAVGYEGMFGIVYASLGILIFNFIPNPSSFEATPNNKIEDFPNFIYQVFSFQNVALFFLVLAGVVIIIILNGVGQAVTKYVSALARAVLGVTSPFLIWMFCLAVGWEDFKWYQLVAYFIITTGTLIYNEILVIPILGFNKNLRRHAAAAAAAAAEEQQLLSGPPQKQSLRGSRRTHRSFKSVGQFNDEPVSNITDQYSDD